MTNPNHNKTLRLLKKHLSEISKEEFDKELKGIVDYYKHKFIW